LIVPGFVFRLLPPRPDFPFTMSPAERATMDDHAAYWAGRMAQGEVIAYGPVNDADGPYGIGIILAADLAGAEALLARDPAVLSPHGFRAELAPMLSLVTPDGRYDAAP
jgi:uncharacterized protein